LKDSHAAERIGNEKTFSVSSNVFAAVRLYWVRRDLSESARHPAVASRFRRNRLIVMDVKKEFGIVIRSKRTHLGLSQGTLAERANLHRTYVTDIERGTRNLTLENISKLAGAFGLPISQLFPAASLLDEANGTKTARSGLSDLVDILIAEDNPKDMELALNAFKQARLMNRIHIVRDGEAALDFILRQNQFRERPIENMPGAVLLDLTLPKIHGLEVLRRIKADPGARNIKVVVLSDSRLDKNIGEATRLGAAGYIIKPVNFHNFSQVTSQLDFSWILLSRKMVSTGNGAPAPQTI
jgi:two-component system response regulator